MQGFIGIMIRDAPFQVSGCASIFLFWETDAAENVNILHIFGFIVMVGFARRRPTGYAGHCFG